MFSVVLNPPLSTHGALRNARECAFLFELRTKGFSNYPIIQISLKDNCDFFLVIKFYFEKTYYYHPETFLEVVAWLFITSGYSKGILCFFFLYYGSNIRKLTFWFS